MLPPGKLHYIEPKEDTHLAQVDISNIHYSDSDAMWLTVLQQWKAILTNYQSSSFYPLHQMLMNVTLTMVDVTTCVTIPLGATTAHVDQDTHYKKMASLVWVSTVCYCGDVWWKRILMLGLPEYAEREFEFTMFYFNS